MVLATALGVGVLALPGSAWAVGDSYVDHVTGQESGGNYAIFNIAGTTQALGRYQFLPSTFAGLGYMTQTGPNRASWDSYTFTSQARAAGVNSLSDLRYTEAGHRLQDQGFHRFTNQNWAGMNGAAQGAIGGTISGVPITREGLLSNAHFLGIGDLNEWAASGFDPSVLSLAAARANGFSTREELQQYLLGRMASAAGTTYDPMFAGDGSGAGMYAATDGFPGLGSRRPVLIQETPPFQGQKVHLGAEG